MNSADFYAESEKILREYFERQDAFETERKGTWTECRYPYGGHAAGISEWGWCDRHKFPSDRCNIILNGTDFICRYHNRSWSKGICPGLRGPLG